jgi:hypothetical protein
MHNTPGCKRLLCDRTLSATERRLLTQVVAAIALGLGCIPSALAQTDYYNTDAGRPVRIEDAYAIERGAFELQLAPLRLERSGRGQYRWGIEPEIAFGVLPRTQLEVGFPISWFDGNGGGASRVANMDVSLLYNLNAETRIPALAVALDVLFPVGGQGPDRVYTSFKGIATKTFRFARLHVNAQYTLGDAPDQFMFEDGAVEPVVGPQALDVSRWMSGIAVDRTFPLKAMLITAEVFAAGSLITAGGTEWNSTVGSRYQLSPRVALDAGLGRRLTGDDRAWSFTMGGAVAFGLPWRQ